MLYSFKRKFSVSILVVTFFCGPAFSAPLHSTLKSARNAGLRALKGVPKDLDLEKARETVETMKLLGIDFSLVLQHPAAFVSTIRGLVKEHAAMEGLRDQLAKDPGLRENVQQALESFAENARKLPKKLEKTQSNPERISFSEEMRLSHERLEKDGVMSSPEEVRAYLGIRGTKKALTFLKGLMPEIEERLFGSVGTGVAALKAFEAETSKISNNADLVRARELFLDEAIKDSRAVVKGMVLNFAKMVEVQLGVQGAKLAEDLKPLVEALRELKEAFKGLEVEVNMAGERLKEKDEK